MKARYLVNKGKKLEQKIRDLQSALYDFSTELEELKLNELADLAGEAGFEFDVSHTKMHELWTRLENAYCRKVTT